MIVSIATQTGLTVYAHFRNADGDVWNGSAFSVYSVLDWSLYFVPSYEQTGSGFYDAYIPSAFDSGDYKFIFYQQNGSSPAPGDYVLGFDNVTVP